MSRRCGAATTVSVKIARPMRLRWEERWLRARAVVLTGAVERVTPPIASAMGRTHEVQDPFGKQRGIFRRSYAALAAPECQTVGPHFDPYHRL